MFNNHNHSNFFFPPNECSEKVSTMLFKTLIHAMRVFLSCMFNFLCCVFKHALFMGYVLQTPIILLCFFLQSLAQSFSAFMEAASVPQWMLWWFGISIWWGIQRLKQDYHILWYYNCKWQIIGFKLVRADANNFCNIDTKQIVHSS